MPSRSTRKRIGLLAAVCWFATIGAAFAQVPLAPGVDITASSGNVAAATATATLAAAVGKVTYICGLQATAGGATAAAVVTLTVANIAGGTMSLTYGGNTGAGVPTAPLVVPFNRCIPANAPNTTIVVSMPSLGAGNTNATVSAWGYQR
jgi:hypothetical protein